MSKISSLISAQLKTRLRNDKHTEKEVPKGVTMDAWAQVEFMQVWVA